MNATQKRDYTLVLFLAAVGLISGFVTASAMRLVLLKGSVFGVIISVAFVIMGVSRDLWAAVRFVIVCTVSYFFSVFVSFFIGAQIDQASMSHGTQGSPIAFFVGGSLGAFLVTSEALFVLLPNPGWEKAAIKGLVWSPVGGLLGAIGSMLDSKPADRPFWLFVVWQAGIAALVGFLYCRNAATDAASTARAAHIKPARRANRRFQASYIVFFGLIAIVFFYFASKSLIGDHSAVVRQKEIANAMAAAPPTANLPPVQQIPTEQVLLLHPIGGYVPVLPFARAFSGTNYLGTQPRPSTIVYSVGYQSAPMKNALDLHEVVSVSITEYPNPDWAKFSTKDVPIPNASIQYAQYIQHESQFGNAILVNSGWRTHSGTGDLYYYWASGNKLVLLIFRGPVIGEFLKEYLEKYPSSM